MALAVEEVAGVSFLYKIIIGPISLGVGFLPLGVWAYLAGGRISRRG